MPRADALLLQLGGNASPNTAVWTSLNEITAVLQAATDHDLIDTPICMAPLFEKTVSHSALGQFFSAAVCAAWQGVPRSVVSEPSMGCIRVIAIHKESLTSLAFACLLSALPYTRSVHTLRLEETNRSFPCQLNKFALSWLVYAVFHPATRASSWRKLVMGNKLVGDVTVLLQQMGDADSRGKVLSVTDLALQMKVDRTEKKRKRDDNKSPATQQTDQMQQLRRAIVKKDSVIRVSPRGDAEQLVVMRVELELELCDFHSEPWCCVLVPGFGFGWVHERDIREQNDWHPELEGLAGELPLTNLELGYSVTMGKTLLLLAATGKSLETLALESSGLQRSVLDDVSRLCPRLKTLTIKSSRMPLSRNSLQRYFSQPTTRSLRSLTLSWRACNHTVLLEILSNRDGYPSVSSLKELRLDKAHYIERFAAMLNTNRTLERLRIDHWSGADASCLLRRHGEVLSVEAMARAFLSVVARLSTKSADSVLGQLNKDVFARIFQFAAVHREVTISSLEA